MVLVNKYPICDNYLSKMLGFAQLYFWAWNLAHLQRGSHDSVGSVVNSK